MLKRLRIHNFKTFLNSEFEFSRRHLLIGKNNSGKTNLCTALRFLGATATADFDQIAIPGGLEGFWHWALDPSKPESRVAQFAALFELPFEGEQVRYVYTLHLGLGKQSVAPSAHPGIQVVRERLEVESGGFRGPTLLDSDGRTARVFRDDVAREDAPRQPEETQAPPGASMLSKVYEQESHRLLTNCKRALGSLSYFALSPALMRYGWTLPDQNPAPSFHETLQPFGNNLPIALFQLKNEDEPRYRRVLSYLQSIEPDLDSINFFVTPDSKPVPYLIMKGGQNRRASWDTLSDGSLCVLALATVFAQAERISELPGWPPPLCIIEEPENSLYRGSLPDLWERLSGAAPNGQFIFTTHSPYFIDLFDRDLASVTRLKRDGSVTVAKSLLEYKDRIEREREEYSASLGEQHFREVFE